MAECRQSFSFLLPPAVVSAAEKVAAEQGVTLAALVERLLREEAEHCGHLAVDWEAEDAGAAAETPAVSPGRAAEEDADAGREQDVRSSPVYGFDIQDGELVPNEQEQATIRWMQMRYLLTGSFNGVARELNERGIPTKRGGPWRASSVRGIMLRAGEVSVAGGC